MTNVKITIPNWFDKTCVWPVVLYRLFKFGYTYRKIYLSEGKWTLVDTKDYYRLNSYKWLVYGNGSKLYAARSKLIGPKKTAVVSMHREIMGQPKGLLVDHKNRNGLDNRRDNLRLATQSQNACNRSKIRTKTSSRYVGASFRKSANKWAAVLTHQGKKIFLGYFDTEIEAARAYDRTAIKLRGEFARLNFPREDYKDEMQKQGG